MRPSQNLPLPLRIYPSFQQQRATLSESTPPSQNIPLFSTTTCDPLRIYPSLSEYTPPFFQQLYPPLPEFTFPPRIYSPFKQLCTTLPESVTPSQKLAPLNKFVCATLPESILPPRIYPPPLFNDYVGHSQNLPLPLRIYLPFKQIDMCNH